MVATTLFVIVRERLIGRMAMLIQATPIPNLVERKMPNACTYGVEMIQSSLTL
jgi:phage terminase Nu1 subunit (DNA packaging protein)